MITEEEYKMIRENKIRALVIGHTGATGRALLASLIASPDVESIVAIGRRRAEGFNDSPKLTQHVVTDMFHLESLNPTLAQGANAAFCCIGTPFNDVTKKSKQDQYRKVDFGIPTSFANYAHAIKVEFFATITGEGTEKEANSNKNMYRVKQDVEKYVSNVGFERVAFIRPGFLNRGKDAGFVEKLMLPGIFGIPVAKVAESMVWAALHQTKPIEGYNGNKELKKLSAAFEETLKK